MSNWQYVAPNGIPQPGTPVTGGGGMGLTFRDPLDARRAMSGFVPSAEYPDGYLGTIRSRREDRLLDSLKNRLNQRSYQRGVHKGEKIDPADYIWPPELDPVLAGITRQATTALRLAPLQTPAELVLQGRLPRGAAGLADPRYAAPNDLRRLAPAWK